MDARRRLFIAVAICVATLVPCASTIMCFQCNSQLDEGCVDINRNVTDNEYYKECVGDFEGKEPFCRKTVLELAEVAPRVIRACGWKRSTSDCYHIDDGHHVERVCQCFQDGCNAASISHVTTAMTAGAALLAATWSRL